MHKAKNHAKVRLQEIRDHGGQVLADFIAHYKLNGEIENDSELKEKAEKEEKEKMENDKKFDERISQGLEREMVKVLKTILPQAKSKMMREVEVVRMYSLRDGTGKACLDSGEFENGHGRACRWNDDRAAKDISRDVGVREADSDHYPNGTSHEPWI